MLPKNLSQVLKKSLIIDIVDCSISSMSLTYGHTPTETMISILEGTERDTGFNLSDFEPIADHFREVRKKYWKFEGELKGIDARILNAQVPGGMLTNMENQLKEQGYADRFDDVLKEVPKVRADLGYIPLVTPTSQIVGTQAVLNVVMGERYKNITKETRGVLLGEYGKTPAPVNSELIAKVLKDGGRVIECRPADAIKPEMEGLLKELKNLSKEQKFDLAEDEVDDALIYALFQQIGLKFLKNRGNLLEFEPIPEKKPELTEGPHVYTVQVNGKDYEATVLDGGAEVQVNSLGAESSSSSIKEGATVRSVSSEQASVDPIKAPLSGNIFNVCVTLNQVVNEGDVVVIMEAMKMETEVRASSSGVVTEILVKEGDNVNAGQEMIMLV